MSSLTVSTSEQIIQEGKYLVVSLLPEKQTAIVRSQSAYIPMANFQETFEKVGQLVKKGQIDTLIFDKTSLTTFHQPSMEWYYVSWKEEMYDLGLRNHYKVLPQDQLFVQSVRIGREKIAKDNPDFDFAKHNIKYSPSVKAALAGEGKPLQAV